jgi:hypothetical protein
MDARRAGSAADPARPRDDVPWERYRPGLGGDHAAHHAGVEATVVRKCPRLIEGVFEACPLVETTGIEAPILGPGGVWCPVLVGPGDGRPDLHGTRSISERKSSLPTPRRRCSSLTYIKSRQSSGPSATTDRCLHRRRQWSPHRRPCIDYIIHYVQIFRISVGDSCRARSGSFVLASCSRRSTVCSSPGCWRISSRNRSAFRR